MNDPEDSDALAAECALGALDGEERERALLRRKVDPVFDAAVADWEERLAPLIELIPEAAPPPDLFAKIEKRVRQKDSSPAGAPPRWRWSRPVAVLAALAACVVIAVGVFAALSRLRPEIYVGALAQASGAPAFHMALDARRKILVVTPAGAPPQSGKSYELWLIAKGAPPLAYGLLDSRRETRTPIRGAIVEAETALWAVTLEPSGGSPSGKPSGPPIFTGRLARS